MEKSEKTDSEGHLERVKEVALSDSLTSAVLIVLELTELKARLSRELDALEDRRKRQAKDHVELLAQLWEELRKIRAHFRIEAQLLHLIQGPANDSEKDRTDQSQPNFS